MSPGVACLWRNNLHTEGMIVPEFWAEARVQHREPGRQITMRRFGWSDNSLEQAQAMAEERAREALQKAVAGEKLDRREVKVPYNGADGVPIREEILGKHGTAVITRNSYGARCLNTPDVFFADVDFQDRGSFKFGLLVWLGVLVGVFTFFYEEGHLKRALGIAFLASTFSGWLSGVLYRSWVKASGGHEAMARKRVRQFLAKHPDWNFHLYRTPAGMRVLATHNRVQPSDPVVKECFAALCADPVYRQMCFRQQCFRARVSAKPWRIGIGHHMRPRPGTWPVKPESLPLRLAWVRNYEERAVGYAACHFIESLGSGAIHSQVRPVIELHDKLSAAHTELPMA